MSRILRALAITAGLFFGLLPWGAKADRLVFLADNLTTGAARIQLLQSARKTIRASIYDVGNDKAGMATLALYRDAARRGVQVELIIDGLTMRRIPAAVITALIDSGVRIKAYHPLSVRFAHQVLRRIHSKHIAVDGAFSDISDRNGREHYFGLSGRDRLTTRSHEALVSGESVKEIERYHDDLWNSGEVVEVKAKNNSWAAIQSANAEMDAALKGVNRPQFQRTNLTELFAQGVDVGEVSFVRDSIEHKATPGFIPKSAQKTIEDNTDTLVHMIREAKNEILIVNPYIVLTPKIKNALFEALSRPQPVKVRIVTNSIDTDDHKLTSAVFDGSKKELLSRGVEIHEYQRDFHLHAKTMVIDRERVYLGSANLDPRSENLNLEGGITFSNRATAVKVIAQTERDMQIYARKVSPSDARTKKSCLYEVLGKLIRNQL